MGSVSFAFYAPGSDLQKVYRNAAEQSAWEDGHRYSGEIGSKLGHGIAQSHRTPVTAVEALAEAERANSAYETEKHGSTYGIPVGNFELVGRARTLEIPVEADEWLSDHDLIERVRRELGLTVGQHIGKLERIEGKVTRRVSVETLPGKSVTEYLIAPVHQGHMTVDFRRTKGYPTQAAARKALTDWLKEQCGLDPHTGAFRAHAERYEIIGLTRRDTGTGMVRGRLEKTKFTMKVKVKTARRKGTPGEIKGWVLYGVAPH